MPYKNIKWVKLEFLDILSDPDHRFIEKLNDEQKGLFLMLFLLMGYYHNNIPTDPKTIKRVLNLLGNSDTIGRNLEVIYDVYSRAIRKSQFVKFKNYNKLHNPIGKSYGVSEGSPRDGVDKNRVEENKKRIDRYLDVFKEKHKEVTGVPYVPNYAKDRILLREYLEFPEKDVISLINEFFESSKNGEVWWSDKLSIGIFKTVTPQLIGRLRRK